MTQLAIISDVHADVSALRDALLHIERLSCDLVVCAGDIVDYGEFPNETIALLQERAIPCIRGNHDRWSVEQHALGARPTHATPSDEAMRFLMELPLAWDAVLDGVRVAVRHATPRSDMEGVHPWEVDVGDVWSWLEEAQADVLLVGHTHIAFALSGLGGGLIANPGALLRSVPGRSPDVGRVYDPASGRFVVGTSPPGGTFGVLELPARRFTVFRASDGVEVEIPRLTCGVTDSRSR